MIMCRREFKKTYWLKDNSILYNSFLGMLNQFVTFNLKIKIDKNVQNKIWKFFENIENFWWGNERILKGKESETFKTF